MTKSGVALFHVTVYEITVKEIVLVGSLVAVRKQNVILGC